MPSEFGSRLPNEGDGSGVRGRARRDVFHISPNHYPEPGFEKQIGSEVSPHPQPLSLVGESGADSNECERIRTEHPWRHRNLECP